MDFATLKEASHYDRADSLSLIATALGVITMGVEVGILMSVAQQPPPHMAVLGRVPDTEHFRNVDRHTVQTVPGLLALRVDERLFFANATALEDRLEDLS